MSNSIEHLLRPLTSENRSGDEGRIISDETSWTVGNLQTGVENAAVRGKTILTEASMKLDAALIRSIAQLQLEGFFKNRTAVGLQERLEVGLLGTPNTLTDGGILLAFAWKGESPADRIGCVPAFFSTEP